MVASDSFADFLREQLAPLGRVALRRMFGKTGVFCDGLMFAMVTDDTLYFRVDDHNREAFKEAESFSPLSYEKKGEIIDLSFWRAPERLFDQPDELVTWAREAIGAAHRVAAKRNSPAPRGKTTARGCHLQIRQAPAHRASLSSAPLRKHQTSGLDEPHHAGQRHHRRKRSDQDGNRCRLDPGVVLSGDHEHVQRRRQ